MGGSGSYDITAPLSGTFYRAPSPDDNPYVTLEQEIRAGDVVCIVESMKVFTEIRAERNGIVKDILIEDEDPVSKGQALMRIELR
jgi:acetyl-CoA carboxylase biotin carboxyl carrier protein